MQLELQTPQLMNQQRMCRLLRLLGVAEHRQTLRDVLAVRRYEDVHVEAAVRRYVKASATQEKQTSAK